MIVLDITRLEEYTVQYEWREGTLVSAFRHQLITQPGDVGHLDNARSICHLIAELKPSSVTMGWFFAGWFFASRTALGGELHVRLVWRHDDAPDAWRNCLRDYAHRHDIALPAGVL